MALNIPSLIGTYDPNRVEIIGTLDVVNASADSEPMSGFAEGTFINLSRNEDLYNNYVGTRGEVSRALNRNASYTLTFTLQQTSSWNAKLFNLLNVETLGLSPDKLAYTAFMIMVPNMATIGIGQCWLIGPPDISLSNGIEAYEWTFFCAGAAITSDVTNI